MTSNGFVRPATFGTLALLMMFSSIATDLYLPAMPDMSRSLGAAPGVIEGSVASYLAGFVLGQLLWGPASDAKGRKRPLLVGIAVFILGSVGCAVAESGEAVLIWRAVQGLGGSAAVVIARAIVTDIFDREQAARSLSTLLAIMAVAPLIGPLAGAQILQLSGWRAIFWTLCGFGVLAFMLTANLPETRTSRDRGTIGTSLSRYGTIAATPAFWRFALAGSFFYGGLFAFIAAAPAIFIEGYGFSANLFAGLLALGTALIVATNLLNVRLIAVIGYVKPIRIGGAVSGIAAIAAMLLALWIPDQVVGLIAAILIYMAMAGLVIANALTGAIMSGTSNTGAASALAGALNFAGGGIGALAIALIGPGSVVGLAIVLAVSGTLTFVASLQLSDTRAM